MKIEPGDVVVNPFGHVMVAGQTLEDGRVVCHYECNPQAHHAYEPERLRLLSKTRGVAMGRECSTEFARSIQKMQEWVKNVRNLPKKYAKKDYQEAKTPKATKEEAGLLAAFLSLSPEEQKKRLAELLGEKDSKNE